MSAHALEDFTSRIFAPLRKKAAYAKKMLLIRLTHIVTENEQKCNIFFEKL